MTLAGPILFVIGGICIGWTIPAFGRHRFFGWLMLVLAGVCLAIASVGSSVTIPKITLNPKPAATATVIAHPSISPSSSPSSK